MANIPLAVTVLRGHLLALAQMDTDLGDLAEELALSETYLTAETDQVKDVRGAIRMSFRELSMLHGQLDAIARARGAVDPADVLTTPPVIEQE